jgi:hypothetical protein
VATTRWSIAGEEAHLIGIAIRDAETALEVREAATQRVLLLA